MDTTSLFADKVLSMLQCLFGLAVFCLVHGGLDKIGEMLNIDLVSKEMTLHRGYAVGISFPCNIFCYLV